MQGIENRQCKAQLIASGSDELATSFEMLATLATRHRVVIRNGILGELDDTLASTLCGRRCICVIDKNFYKLHEKECHKLVAQLPVGSRLLDLEFSEQHKTLAAVSMLFSCFDDIGVARRDVIAAIGGGVCCDVVSFAAAVYRRGIQHIKVPTTLLGVVDAGIGVKNAVNFGDAKNRVGTFFPPELSLLDPSLTHHQPYRDFRCGIAEIVKVGLASSDVLFTTMEAIADGATSEDELKCQIGTPEVVRLAVDGLLGELSNDLYEVAELKRAADLGHSFSPSLESLFVGQLAHGDAVAFEMLFLSRLACNLGYISKDYLCRIEGIYRAFRLPMVIEGVNRDDILSGLQKTTLHRGGSLNMPIPIKGPGTCLIVQQLAEVSLASISETLKQMQNDYADGLRLTFPSRAGSRIDESEF